MSQGKAWDKDEVITTLEPYFKLGCGVAKACEYAGIPRTTVQTWIENDETLRLKVNAWMNEPNALARRNWKSKLEEGDFTASKEWITRREKDDFGDSMDITSKGEPIKGINYIVPTDDTTNS